MAKLSREDLKRQLGLPMRSGDAGRGPSTQPRETSIPLDTLAQPHNKKGGNTSTKPADDDVYGPYVPKQCR